MEHLQHDRLQQDVFMYTWNTYPQSRYCMWHTPNEMKRDMFLQEEILKKHNTGYFHNLFRIAEERFRIALAKRKAIGVLKGVVDLTMYYQNKLYCFDIKIGHDKLSPEQLRFIETVKANGGEFFELRTFNEAKEIIDNIFAPCN